MKSDRKLSWYSWKVIEVYVDKSSSDIYSTFIKLWIGKTTAYIFTGMEGSL